MKMRRLGAAVAAASLAAVAFVASANPAGAWDLKMCERTWAQGKDHKDCDKFKTSTTKDKPKPTREHTPTTATPGTKGPTTTVVVKPAAEKPTPAKVQPKFTG